MAYISSGPRVGGKIAVVDVAADKVVAHIKMGTGGGRALVGGIGAATSEGLATDPFWWFER